MRSQPMLSRSSRCFFAAVFLSIMASPRVHAQWAVVDTPATAQLIKEVTTLQQAVRTAESQLAQSQQALATMTGPRGMQLLLSGVNRNYLPTNWAQLTAAMQGGGAYSSLSGAVRFAVNANAVLSPQQLSALSSADQQRIVARRQQSALQQALAQQALSNASTRFTELQTLIAAISSAPDQKSILELQARISAEVAMLQNEQTKLSVLNQATLAQQSVSRQQEIEQAVADQGQFATRFQPVP
jgi:type IV secretion system protein VirB5